MLIKAEPKSVGYTIEDRYEGDYNGVATIEKVEGIKDGAQKGTILVHLRGTKNQHIVDWYGHKQENTAQMTFSQQMLNRAGGAQQSAGVELFSGEVDGESDKDVRKAVFGIFKELVGKKVYISQYKKQGFERPNINYKFDENARAIISRTSNNVATETTNEEDEIFG